MFNFLGLYYPVDSFWHTSDPRCKLLAVVTFLFGTMTAQGYELYIFLLLAIGIYLTAALPLKIGLRILVKFKWLLLITFLANVLFMKNMGLYPKILAATEIVTRLALTLIIAFWLTLVTKPFNLIDGLAGFLKPLTRLRIPISELALFTGLVIRFIPELWIETEQIVIAQRLRGIHPALKWRQSGFWIKSTLIPVFLATIRKSAVMATAMQARGYRPGQVRTVMSELQFKWTDWLVVSLSLLAILYFFIRIW